MKQLSELHELAKKYEREIKETIAERFSDSVDDLVPLIDKEDGVFISEVNPSTLCCLVIGRESGYLYVVTARIVRQEELMDFYAIITG